MQSQPRHRGIGPLIGKDNEFAYGALLGLTPERVRELVDDGTLWPKGMARPNWIRGSEADVLPLAGE
jgi:hypothetical protein